MIIGSKPGGANSGDSANVVHVVDVASHTNSANNFSFAVANELPSCLEKHWAICNSLQRLHE